MEKDIKEQLGCLVDELSKYLEPLRTWSEENAIEDYTKLVNVNNKIKDIIQDKEEENEEEDEENVLTDKEIEKLNKRLSDIEIEQRQAWGLHRISGGFVNAEFDYVEDDKIYITLTDGVQSDCQNTTNVTHVSLWRNNLEWTD